ncbi:HD domain-containing protein [Pseudonocardia sp. CA-142604]|uniref:HD domain-containing protein n=1 Tax=Pseudonocardia sp. CA-142604 TaxID=3240024 RepID=UPI003D8B338E
MSEYIAGVAIPDSRIADETTAFIQDVESPVLYHHSRRTYLFGALHGQRLGIKADPELLYVAAMFHDLGLVEGHRNLTRRFEVDGADAARDFLLSHDVPADAVRRVWLSIAVHSTHGIPEFMEPEVALLAAGVRIDVDGAGLDLLDPVAIEEIIAVHPRYDFKRQGLKAIAEGVKDRPGTLLGTIAADMLAHYSPEFKRVDFVDVVRNNAWPE